MPPEQVEIWCSDNGPATRQRPGPRHRRDDFDAGQDYRQPAARPPDRTTHGHTRDRTGTATYRTWQNMLTRCRNPKAIRWERYGGRGIKVCDRWLTFANFLADMGERPAGRTLDRIAPDGHYEPGNCRWATPLEQAANREYANRGKTHCANGHPFDESNTAIDPKTGWRRCRACCRERARQRRAAA